MFFDFSVVVLLFLFLRLSEVYSKTLGTPLPELPETLRPWEFVVSWRRYPATLQQPEPCQIPDKLHRVIEPLCEAAEFPKHLPKK